MPSSKSTYDLSSGAPSPVVKEEHIEYGFIGKLQDLKYEYRADIRDRAALEKNFREKFEALNRVKLTESEFARLLDGIVTSDVFTAAKTLRSINAFTRDDGTALSSASSARSRTNACTARDSDASASYPASCPCRP